MTDTLDVWRRQVYTKYTLTSWLIRITHFLSFCSQCVLFFPRFINIQRKTSLLTVSLSLAASLHLSVTFTVLLRTILIDLTLKKKANGRMGSAVNSHFFYFVDKEWPTYFELSLRIKSTRLAPAIPRVLVVRRCWGWQSSKQFISLSKTQNHWILDKSKKKWECFCVCRRIPSKWHGN